MRRLSKLFIAIIIAIFISYNFIPIVSNALSIGNGNGDVWAPEPATSATSGEKGDIPDTPTETVTTNDTYQEVPREYHNKIEGNVYDQGIDKGVKDVLVKLLYTDGTVVQTQRTDANGNYSFEPSPGDYRIQFSVGDLEENDIDMNDSDAVKNVLKYNGVDYYASQIPSSASTETGNIVDIETKKEILTLKKKATQVMLCVDYSETVRTTDIVTQDGQTKKRLDVEIEAAKNLISKLLDADSAIYITLIAFDGDNHYRVLDKGLSRDQQKLYKGLDDARNVKVIGGTNIVAALDVAQESFVIGDNKEDTSRVVVMVTDGLPSGCYEDSDKISAGGDIGKEKSGELIRQDDDINTIRSKLDNEIIPHTARKLKELKDDGIEVMALVTKSDDDEDNQYIAKIFNDETTNMHKDINNGTELADGIERKINEEINKTATRNKTESKETVDTRKTQTYDMEFETEEDKQRMKEISQNYDTFSWGNTKDFQVIDNYDKTKDQEMAKRLSQNTRFTVTSKDPVHIDDVPTLNPDTTKEENGVKKTYHEVLSPQTWTINLGLHEKSPAEIDVIKYASGLRVTIATGEVVYYKTTSIDDSPDRDPKNIPPLLSFMDEEIAQGSKVEVEYTIHTTSQRATDFNNIRIIDYIPYGFKFDMNSELLSEKHKRNSDYWDSQINNDDLDNANFFNTDKSNQIKDKKRWDNIISRPAELHKGESTDVKIVLTVIIGGLDDYNNIAQNYNEAEVFSYKSFDNLESIDGIPSPVRMKSSINAKVSNKKGGEFGGQYLFPASFDGGDYQSSGDANIVTVLPPTGEPVDSKKTIGLIVTLVSLDAVLIAFLKKQLKLKSKNKK